MSDRLDEAILSAHERGDGKALAGLYEEAAGRLERAGDTDAACFFLTQAYVFALEGGLPAARHLHRRLAAHGREE
jgi:hypothetical protein